MEAARAQAVDYPDSDGKPMSDNTLQFQWIVTIKENLDAILPDFVGGDLLWYPVEGHPEIRMAPDALVALGRPKGFRGSYRTWEEDGVVPQVVFEIWSPGNTLQEGVEKHRFYERYGVEEFYLYDPDRHELFGWVRGGDQLLPIANMNGWTSPLLQIRFTFQSRILVLYGADGEHFRTFGELKQERREAEARAEEARSKAKDAEAKAKEAVERADAAEDKAKNSDARAQEAEAQLEALRAKLRSLGLEP